jgi:glycerophosphoryl diester phosphodiesterase
VEFLMRAFPLLLPVVAMLLAVPASAQRDDPVARSAHVLTDPAAKGVLVASHRACWGAAPENSIVGIETCIAHGIDVIEIDVRQTADGQLVLLHDATLDRTTNGHGRLSAITLADLRKLRQKPGMGGLAVTELTAHPVPTLQEALDAARGRILINMDAKDPLQDRIFAEVEKAGMAGQVIMKMRAAPDDPQLAGSRFAKTSMFMPVVFACNPAATDRLFCETSLAATVRGYGRFRPIGYELVYADPEFLKASGVRKANRRSRIWVNSLKPEMAGGVSDATALADPDGVWGTLIDQGVTMIQTDHPEALLAYLRKRGLHD